MFRNTVYNGILEYLINFCHKNDIWKYCKIHNSPADGHCLLHSIVSSLKYQFLRNVNIDTNYLLGVISNEISQYPEIYMCFIENIDGLFTIESVLSNCQDCKRTPLFLHKCPDHYNAIVPFSIEPLWQHSHAYVDGVLNSDNADDKPNALLSNPTQLDEPSSLNYRHTDVPNFLHRLQMYRKTHPTNLLSGSLNINSICNKFSTAEYILQNAYAAIYLAYVRPNWMTPFQKDNFM